MRCDQCEALIIQGVFCHETGCPNTNSRYDAKSGDWVKQYECRECGSMADDGVVCCDDDEGDYDYEEEDEEGQECPDCGEMYEDCVCNGDHPDTDSLEDRGITLGSYAS